MDNTGYTTKISFFSSLDGMFQSLSDHYDIVIVYQFFITCIPIFQSECCHVSNILGIETVKETLEKVSIQEGLTNIRVSVLHKVTKYLGV